MYIVCLYCFVCLFMLRGNNDYSSKSSTATTGIIACPENEDVGGSHDHGGGMMRKEVPKNYGPTRCKPTVGRKASPAPEKTNLFVIYHVRYFPSRVCVCARC